MVIYNSVPGAGNPAANVVVGQPNLNTCTGGATANKLNAPGTMWTDGVRLVVADAGNNRVRGLLEAAFACHERVMGQ